MHTEGISMSWQKTTLFICALVALQLIAATHSASTQPEHIKLTLGEESPVTDLPCLEWAYYRVEVTEPCMDLNVAVRHQRGEPNVYISRGATKYPTESSLTWSSYNWGSDYKTISSWDPEFTVGTFYIGVHAYCGDDVDTGNTPARYTIIVESVPTDHPHEEIPMNGAVSNQIAATDYQYYRFCVPNSCVNLEVNLDNCLDSTKCPSSYAYPELLVSRSIMFPTINDHSWKLAAIERRSVMLTHDDPEFYPGHYYVGVYGWCTPADQCDDPAICGPCDNYTPAITYNVSLLADEITSGCKPKNPLELCEGAASVVKASMFVLLLSALLAGFVLCI